MMDDLLNQIVSLSCVVVLLSLIVAIITIDSKIVEDSDFKNYITGVNILKSDDRNKIYDIDTQTKYQHSLVSNERMILPYRSLPPLVFIYLPFSFFNYFIGYKLFLISSVLVLFLIFLSKRRKLLEYKLFIILALLFWPNYLNLLLSQSIFFFALVFFYIYKFIKTEQMLKLGLVCGLLILRPQYLLIVPFVLLMIDRYKYFFKGFVLSTAVITLMSLLLIGKESLLSYPSFVLATETHQYGSFTGQMPGVAMLIVKFSELLHFDLSTAAILFVNIILFFIFFFAIKKRFKDSNTELQFSSAVLLFLPFMGHVYYQDMVLFQFPLFFLLNHNFLSLMLVYFVINFKLTFIIPLSLVFSAFYVLNKKSD